MVTVKRVVKIVAMAGAIASFSTYASAADTQVASYTNVGSPSGHIVWLKNTDGAPVNYTAVSGQATQAGPNGTGGYIFTTNDVAGPGGGPKTPATIGAINTSFFYHLADLGLPVTGLAAQFTLFGQAANGNPADCMAGCTSGKSIEQGGINGGFSFIYSGATTTIGATTFHAGDNLLSGSFSNAYISGKVGSSSPAYTAEDFASLSGDVSFNSDFLTFDAMSLDAIKLTIGGATPTLRRSAPGQAMSSFRSVTTGEFHSNPEPMIPGVPEPGAWALMLIGFGSAGAMLRARRRVGLAVA